MSSRSRADGTLQPAKVYAYEGGTPGSERQAVPHLHCVYASPDEAYLYANDLGTDRIYKYDIIASDKGWGLRGGTPASFSLPAEKVRVMQFSIRTANGLT